MIQACEFTLLGCLALLSISPAFVDSSGMIRFVNRLQLRSDVYTVHHPSCTS